MKMINRSPSDFESTPFTVTVSRGPIVESCHQVIAAISDADGKLLRSWGDVKAAVYLRSAIKPLQALPLVETGAADALNLTNQELSLACASHTGENLHVDAVTQWLKRIGLSFAGMFVNNVRLSLTERSRQTRDSKFLSIINGKWIQLHE